jgi:hypothetical protein
MATSTCVKCGGHEFEMQRAKPTGSEYTYLFVQCLSCGGVVGVVDDRHTPTLLDEIKDQLGVDLPSDGGSEALNLDCNT